MHERAALRAGLKMVDDRGWTPRSQGLGGADGAASCLGSVWTAAPAGRPPAPGPDPEGECDSPLRRIPTLILTPTLILSQKGEFAFAPTPAPPARGCARPLPWGDVSASIRLDEAHRL